MKTVKEILLTLFIVVIIIACSQPIEYNGNVKAPTKKTDFQLEADVIAASFHSHDDLSLKVPSASNCNLGESVIVAIFGVKGNQNPDGDIELLQGRIDLVIPDSGCYLIGNFNGRATHDSGRLIIDATIKVQYGVGTFKADGGELRLAIIGVNTSKNMMRYEIEIDGYLENKTP